MELKRKQNVLRNKFWFRVVICLCSLLGSALYLAFKSSTELWTIITGVCGSALVWSLVELVDFFVQTHYQYESERNTFFGIVTNHFSKMKNIIRANDKEIPMHDLREIVRDFYDETNNFIFNSNVYPVSAEFNKCCNYIERMYWKFDACCIGIHDECEERNECYEKLFNALLLIKEEKEDTSKRIFDGFFSEKSSYEMTNIELSFDKYELPDNLVDDDVIGNIKEVFIIPGNIRKTTTFIPDLDFREFYNNRKSNALFICLCLLFRKADSKASNPLFKRILTKIKKLLNKIKWRKISKVRDILATIIAPTLLVITFLLIAFSSSNRFDIYKDIFVYISLVMSALLLPLTLSNKLKTDAQKHSWFYMIIAIAISYGYAALRVNLFPNVLQFEDFLTALVILASYFILFFDKRDN